MATLFRKRKRKDNEVVLPTKTDVNESQSDNEESNPNLDLDLESKESRIPSICSFTDLGLTDTLVSTCRQLGLKRPTPVQRAIIPFLIKHKDKHILSLAPTGSGKTAAFVLPILHHWQADPFGIYAIILTPTRELAQQIHQQVLALGNGYHVKSALVVGGLDRLRQSQALDSRPHFCVATPGRLAALLKGPRPPVVSHLKFLVLDEADRLLTPQSGFRSDLVDIIQTTRGSAKGSCQMLLFSATMSQTLDATLSELAGPGLGQFPLQKFSTCDDAGSKDNDKAKTGKDQDRDEVSSDADAIPIIPPGLRQEYIFMPSRVRDAYLVTAVKHLIVNGGQVISETNSQSEFDQVDSETDKARSAIIFVPTCERAALISTTLDELGVSNVALHSYLSQNRRLASLAKFKSQQVLVLVATDVASRGLDIPTVDLVLQSQLPRQATAYVHRVGRTARAGRRGRAISLVAECDVSLVHAAERASGRELEKCTDVTDDMAIKLLGSVTKAARLAKMKLQDMGFDELVQKFETRKRRAKKERQRLQEALGRSAPSK